MRESVAAGTRNTRDISGRQSNEREIERRRLYTLLLHIIYLFAVIFLHFDVAHTHTPHAASERIWGTWIVKEPSGLLPAAAEWKWNTAVSWRADRLAIAASSSSRKHTASGNKSYYSIDGWRCVVCTKDAIGISSWINEMVYYNACVEWTLEVLYEVT